MFGGSGRLPGRWGLLFRLFQLSTLSELSAAIIHTSRVSVLLFFFLFSVLLVTLEFISQRRQCLSDLFLDIDRYWKSICHPC